MLANAAEGLSERTDFTKNCQQKKSMFQSRGLRTDKRVGLSEV